MAEILKGALKHNWIFWVCLITSIFLIVTSFFIPPLAVIDGSVLASVGELFGFAALGNIIAAIEKGIDAKVEHNGTSITIGDLNKEKGRHRHRMDYMDFQDAPDIEDNEERVDE